LGIIIDATTLVFLILLGNKCTWDSIHLEK
jgi:hypothetical protein